MGDPFVAGVLCGMFAGAAVVMAALRPVFRSYDADLAALRQERDGRLGDRAEDAADWWKTGGSMP